MPDPNLISLSLDLSLLYDYAPSIASTTLAAALYLFRKAKKIYLIGTLFIWVAILTVVAGFNSRNFRTESRDLLNHRAIAIQELVSINRRLEILEEDWLDYPDPVAKKIQSDFSWIQQGEDIPNIAPEMYLEQRTKQLIEQSKLK